jgi:protease-4
MAFPPERNADYLTDRRQLSRKLSFWRIGAFAALIVAAFAVGWRTIGGNAASRYQAHVARVTISGVITGETATLRMLDDLAKSEAQAVILSIESPGGTTTGAVRLYEAIRRVADKKPTVAVVRGMAASGAYIAALGADRIFAQGNSLVGSIGVLFQFPNVGKLLDGIGVKLEEVKSSPLKASPNGFEPTSPEARAALAALVSDSYEWFRDLVRQRRSMNEAQLGVVADGRVFTGRQSLTLKLIDAIGGEREAIAWLESERGLRKELPVRDWRPSRQTAGLGLLGASAAIVESAGLPTLSNLLRKIEDESDRQSLDGLLAIWQTTMRN